MSTWPGRPFFHGAGGDVHVQSSLLQQAGAGEGQGLGGHVVDVAYQLQNLPVGLLGGLPQEGPDAVGLFKLLGADAHADGGGQNLVRLEQVQGVAYPNHVGHRVQSPHLVEVHVSHGAAVGLGFRLGDGVVHPSGVGFHLLRQGEVVDDRSDVARRGVVMMVVVRLPVVMVVAIIMVVLVAVAVLMPMLVFVVVMFFPVVVEMVLAGDLRGGGLCLLLAVHRHRHVGASDAAGGGPLGLQVNPGEP